MADVNVSWEFDLGITPEEAERFMEIEDKGRIQRVIDSSFVHYMRQKMPWNTGLLALKSVEYVSTPGLVTVNSKYAHYMNEGILYVNPSKGSSGFPVYQDGVLMGFKGYRGKRIPSGRPLMYRGAPTRGAHFVERTISENKQDIINEAMRSMKHD